MIKSCEREFILPPEEGSMVCFHCFGHACLFSRFALVLLFGFGIPCCLGSNDIRFGSLVASSRALLFNLAQWLSLSLLAHINARSPKALKADRRLRSPSGYGCLSPSFLMLFCCRWPTSVPCFSILVMRWPRPPPAAATAEPPASSQTSLTKKVETTSDQTGTASTSSPAPSPERTS